MAFFIFLETFFLAGFPALALRNALLALLAFFSAFILDTALLFFLMIFFFDTLMADLFLVLVARLIASSFLVAACCAFLFIVFLIGIFPELTAVDAAAFFVISFFSSFFSAFFTALSADLLLAFATAFASFLALGAVFSSLSPITGSRISSPC